MISMPLRTKSLGQTLTKMHLLQVHTSLVLLALVNFVDEQMNAPAGANVIKPFTAVSYDFHNKLECLSLASLSSLVKS